MYHAHESLGDLVKTQFLGWKPPPGVGSRVLHFYELPGDAVLLVLCFVQQELSGDGRHPCSR